MPEKIKKNLLGRTVVKKTFDMGGERVKSRVVYDREGNVIKNRSVKTSSNGGNTNRSVYSRKGDVSKVKKTVRGFDGSKTTRKSKTMTNPETKTSVTKQTYGSSGMKKQRSVTVKKPGETSTRTNMGALRQAAEFRRQIKKNK